MHPSHNINLASPYETKAIIFLMHESVECLAEINDVLRVIFFKNIVRYFYTSYIFPMGLLAKNFET